MGRLYPEHWRNFVAVIPEAERGDLMAAFEKRLNDPDPKVHLPAARAWSVYEGSCSTLLPSPQTVAAFGEERHALGLSRIEAHYFRHGIFLQEDQLLQGVQRIRSEEHTSELQSLMRISYAVFCLKKKKQKYTR